MPFAKCCPLSTDREISVVFVGRVSRPVRYGDGPGDPSYDSNFSNDPQLDSPVTDKYRVVITDFINDDLAPEKEILGDLADVDALDGYSEDGLVGRVENAHALMVYHHLGVYRNTIERLTCCRLIIRCGVGYDNVDHAFARERGIPVANVPDYGTADVADSAVGLMLALTRGIHYANSRLQKGLGEWCFREVQPLTRLRGQVFAVVGLGRIGTATALRAKALGMDVAYYDPYKPDGYDKSLGVRHVERLDDLLCQAHVLSLHCPLTNETRHMIDAAAMAKLPPGSYLINTARGEVVDTTAVPAAIAGGQLAGAGIDVLPHEPPRDDDPLIAAWRNPDHPAHHRLILNPHIAFYCQEGCLEMRIKGAQACRKALLGEPIPNVINRVAPV
jgi:D-3-phosphoglycerate dehydrogenase/C-terminal binding protein